MTKEKQDTIGEKSIIHNTKLSDSSSKLIFGDNILSSQFFRDYADMEILRKIQPEDIEDVSERYVPLYSTQRESDTVKKVNISRYLSGKETENPLNLPLYIVSLIEHKTKVEYNVIMQVLRYMVYIWEDYEKEMNRQHPGISRRRDFRYPPILPIVYYEGDRKWTAPMELSERILCGELLEKYLPHFRYQLVRLHDYSNEDLLEKGDEISLAMLINKIQRPEDISAFISLPAEQVEEILKDTPENLLDTIANVFRALLHKMNLPPEEAEDVISRIKERKVGELFANVTMDIQAERRKSREALERLEKERIEAKRERDRIEKERDEAEKRVEIYKLISKLVRKENSDAQIIEALTQSFPLTEDEAKAELEKIVKEE